MESLFLLPLLVAPILAQQTPELRVVARTEARGGDVERCGFDAAGTRMVTTGQHRDLLFWDLLTLRVLSRLELPVRYVTALALHPTEAWALVGTTTGDFASGRLYRLDLMTGVWTPLGRHYALAASFDQHGRYLAVALRRETCVRVEVFATEGVGADSEPSFARDVEGLGSSHLYFAPDGGSLYVSDLRPVPAGNRHVRLPLDGGEPVPGAGGIAAFGSDGHPIGPPTDFRSWSVSPDGSCHALLEKWLLPKAVQRVSPEATEWDLRPHTDSWLTKTWAAPGGAVVVVDTQDQTHVLGPDPDRHRLCAGHRGSVTGLQWSPDGRFLAVQSMAALRIVDRGGTVVLDRAGSHGVVPGDTGPEFVVADRDGLRRWNARVGRWVGDMVEYRDGAPELVGDRPMPLRGTGEPLYAAMTFTAVGDAWICGSGRVDGRASPCVRIGADGEVSAVSPSAIPGAFHRMRVGGVLADPTGARALTSWISQSGGCYLEIADSTVFGALRAFAADGTEVFTRAFRPGVHWLRRFPDGKQVLLGLGGGALVELDANTLAERRQVDTEPALRWLEFVTTDRAIGGDGTEVSWLDPRDWGRTPATLPDGVGPVRLGKRSPDGRHLALAGGYQVWILVLP